MSSSVEPLLHQRVEVAEGSAEAALEGLSLEEEGPYVEQQAVYLHALGVPLFSGDVDAQSPHGCTHVSANDRRKVSHYQP